MSPAHRVVPPAPARRLGRRRRRTDLVVVHCAATPASMDVGVVEIDRWHRARGFRGVGYHFVIRRSGEVELGRPLEEIGAHARGHNDRSVGVCLVGGRGDAGGAQANFAGVQYDALWRLLGALAPIYPEAEALGHADLPNVRKDCPCFDVRAWMEARAAAGGSVRGAGATS